jgi:hypothetical protein
MSDDILNEVEDLLDSLSDEPDETVGGNPCYYRKKLFDKIPQLVAEIKQLRHEKDESAEKLIKNLNYIKWLDGEYKKEYRLSHREHPEQWKRE